MNQTMEIYMARKKRVPSHYNPNSYRIFDNDVSDASLGDSKMNKGHIERKKEPAPSHPREPDRRNCPHPWHSRFLRHNIRLLNEPVCTMATTVTDSEQNKWWPTESVEYQLKVPHQSDDTTQRIDFVNHKSYTGNSRHSSNPLIIPTKGILPVTTSKTKADAGDVLLEKISYAHNYNCRLDPSEPRRGKLHGSFVWNQIIKDHQGEQVVESPWKLRDIAKAQKVAVVPYITAQEKAKENRTDVVEQKNEKETLQFIPPIDGLPQPKHTF